MLCLKPLAQRLTPQLLLRMFEVLKLPVTVSSHNVIIDLCVPLMIL